MDLPSPHHTCKLMPSSLMFACGSLCRDVRPPRGKRSFLSTFRYVQSSKFRFSRIYRLQQVQRHIFASVTHLKLPWRQGPCWRTAAVCFFLRCFYGNVYKDLISLHFCFCTRCRTATVVCVQHFYVVHLLIYYTTIYMNL